MKIIFIIFSFVILSPFFKLSSAQEITADSVLANDYFETASTYWIGASYDSAIIFFDP